MTNSLFANQIFDQAKKDHDAGNVAEAEKGYLKLLDIAPGHPDVLHLLGVLYGQTGHFEDAEKLITKAITAVPGDPNFYYNLGNVLMQVARWDDAAGAFQNASEIAPDDSKVAFNLGLALKKLDKLDRAEEAFRKVISLDGSHAEAMAELSAQLGQQGKLDEAISFQERAIELKPQTANFQFNLGMLQLRRREWDAAIKSFNLTFGIQRWHVPALASKAVALFEMGDDPAATNIVDVDNRLEISQMLLPAEINAAALAESLATHKSCIWERGDTTTRDGAQTGNLTAVQDPLIAAFVSLLTTRIEEYIDGKQRNPNDPFLAQIPEKWRYSIWATILEKEGHQLPHLHPAAWVSGVYYLEVPEAITDPMNDTQSGWIEFGAPGYGITPVRPPKLRQIMPEPEKLIFFPSYFFHRTVPLSGTARRISIAFDVIPTKWRK